MKTREWITEKIQEIENARKEAIQHLGNPDKEHLHEMLVDVLADMVIATAFLQSSLTLLHAGGRWDEELNTKE